MPLTSWLSQATPRAPISLGPPASAPARPRGPATTARQRHVSLSCVTRALRPRPTGPTCRRRSSRRPRPRQAHLSVAPSDAPAPRPAHLPASLAHAPQTSRAHCPSAADSPAPMSGPSLPTRPRQSRPKSPAVILAAPFPGHARRDPRPAPLNHPATPCALTLPASAAPNLGSTPRDLRAGAEPHAAVASLLRHASALPEVRSSLAPCPGTSPSPRPSALTSLAAGIFPGAPPQVIDPPLDFSPPATPEPP